MKVSKKIISKEWSRSDLKRMNVIYEQSLIIFTMKRYRGVAAQHCLEICTEPGTVSEEGHDHVLDVSPLVHGVVDQGVDAAVGHGQPVECQEHVWGVPGLHEGGVVEEVDEVDMVGEPADAKDSNHNTKHFNNLQQSQNIEDEKERK